MITIRSGDPADGVTESNDQTGHNVVITKPYGGSIWATSSLGAQWISYVDSGQGGAAVPNLFPPGGPSATFFLRFTTAATILSGGLRIWADDVAQVLVDSELTPRIGLPGTLVPDDHCIDSELGGIGCQPLEYRTLDLAGLAAGEHTIAIQAWQLWGDTFGVMYEGQIEFVPEPSTFGLAAMALAAIAFRLRRHRR